MHAYTHSTDTQVPLVAFWNTLFSRYIIVELQPGREGLQLSTYYFKSQVSQRQINVYVDWTKAVKRLGIRKSFQRSFSLRQKWLANNVAMFWTCLLELPSRCLCFFNHRVPVSLILVVLDGKRNSTTCQSTPVKRKKPTTRIWRWIIQSKTQAVLTRKIL